MYLNFTYHMKVKKIYISNENIALEQNFVALKDNCLLVHSFIQSHHDIQSQFRYRTKQI